MEKQKEMNRNINSAGYPIGSDMTRCSESGRSMVEMLGTLAIIGVLSIMGIAGFRHMMNKHQANSILNEAKMHSVLMAGKALNQGLPEVITLEKMSYDFTYAKESEVGYSLSLAGVEKGVCQALANVGKLGWAEQVLINNGADCGTENSVTFYINTGVSNDITNDARVVACESDADCGECGSCGAQKVCVFYDSDCSDPAKPYCNKGKCQGCEVGKFKTIYGCQPCDKEGLAAATNRDECLSCPNRLCLGTNSLFCDGIVSDDRITCHWQCKPENIPYNPGAYNAGYCTPCSELSSIQAIKLGWGNIDTRSEVDSYIEVLYNTCKKCSDRDFVPNGRSGFCSKKCQQGEVLDTNGECHKCGEKFFLGSVLSTPYPHNKYNELYEKCMSCSNMFKGYGGYDSCQPCTDSTESIDTRDKTQCDRCKGTRYYDGRYCIKCPENLSGLTPEQQEQCTPAE